MGSVPPRVLLFVRFSLAALWTFEGLWLKVIDRNLHELKIVSSGAKTIGLPGLPTMIAIGLAETVLAIGIASGIWWKQLAWLQLGALVLMNGLGILLGGGEIRDPISLLVHNLPTFACIAIILSCGPGSWRKSADE